MQKIVVFDIDNTLYDGTMGVDLLKGLMKEGVFPPEAGKQIISWVRDYRDDKMDRYDLFDKVYPLYSKSIKGSTPEYHQEIANQVYSVVRERVFSFSGDLVKFFKDLNFITIALTGSSYEMAHCICNDLGIELYDGAKSVTQDGIFNGDFLGAPSRSEIKKKYLLDILDKNIITPDFDNSFAIGDSESERDLFNLVGNAVVFNPHPAFAEEVAKSDWTVANESNILSRVKEML